jgi:hypothetical protein
MRERERAAAQRQRTLASDASHLDCDIALEGDSPGALQIDGFCVLELDPAGRRTGSDEGDLAAVGGDASA